MPFRVMYISVDGAGFEKEPRTTSTGEYSQPTAWDQPRQWSTQDAAQSFADEQQAGVQNDNPWGYRWKVIPA